jgi:hypothetical protein
MEPRRVIFLSAVSNEFDKVPPESRHIFQSYRDVLKHAFLILAPHYEVIVQEDLPLGFGDLLETLDREITRSLIVIHLVGELAGFAPPLAPLRELQNRHPDLLDCIPELRAAVGALPCISPQKEPPHLRGPAGSSAITVVCPNLGR